MDKLANEGVVFTDGHSSSTVCSPSRYGLLTGRYSWRSSLKSGVCHADGDCLIENGRATLATVCKKAGYNTAMVGKWHLLIQYPGTIGDRDWTKPSTDGPNDKGFDYFFGLAASMNYGVLTYTENRYVTEAPTKWTRKKTTEDGYRNYMMCPPFDDERMGKGDVEVAPSFSDDRVLETFTNKAVEYINKVATDAKNGKPFFLYFPVTSPHLPHSVHPDFIGKSKDGGKYGDFMQETDYRIGQIMKALSDNGIDENTLIFFSSDNGAETNYKWQRDELGHYCNYHFRGGKRDIYEGGHRLPFFVRWPNGVKPGVSDQIVCQTDLLATLAELLDVELASKDGEDSFSFLPELEKPNGGKENRTSIINQSASGYLAYRQNEWKLIIAKPSKNSPENELYNLKDDIQEQNNLFGQYPGIEEELKQKLTSSILNGRTTSGEKQMNDGGNWWKQLIWMIKP